MIFTGLWLQQQGDGRVRASRPVQHVLRLHQRGQGEPMKIKDIESDEYEKEKR